MTHQSDLASPGGLTPARRRTQRLSMLVMVPATSAKRVAGKTTWAVWQVSEKKKSETARKERLEKAFRIRFPLGAETAGLEPTTHMAFTWPVSAAWRIS